jgi:hypothetical protein
VIKLNWTCAIKLACFWDVGPVDSDQAQLKNKKEIWANNWQGKDYSITEESLCTPGSTTGCKRNIGKLIWYHQIQNGSGNGYASVYISSKRCNGSNDDNHVIAPLECVHFQPDDLRYLNVFRLGALRGTYTFFTRNRNSFIQIISFP